MSKIGKTVFVIGVILALGSMAYAAFLESIIFGMIMTGVLAIFVGLIIMSLTVTEE